MSNINLSHGQQSEHQANADLHEVTPILIYALRNLYEQCRQEAAETGLSDEEMVWLSEARSALTLVRE